MDTARESIYTLMNKARTAKMARVRSAVVVAFLLAALLWLTQWPSLRPGLVILLGGQIGVIVILLRRSFTASREMQQVAANVPEKNAFTHWFDGEAVFARQLGIIEDLIRTIGFLMLGYGFWTATGSVLIALTLGIIYPVFAYFGMERRKHLRAQRILQAEKDGIAALLNAN